jgi:ABC-2 type transport system ATP-binding protein
VEVAPAVAVDGLTRSYGRVRAVDDLTLAVPTGAVCALLGPNGAGKTTLVECLEGFRTPDAGRVRVLGLDPHRDRDRLMPRIGVLLQEGGTYKAATPRELVRLFARFHTAPADPDDLLERLDLTAAAGRRLRTLSGGQQQRVALALALVGRPELLVLDEPTTGVDPHARRAVWALLRDLRAQGTTILFSTHQLAEAEQEADLVAVVDRGRLRALDSPAALVAGGGDGHLVVTGAPSADPAAVAADLAAAVGHPVQRAGPGRWTVAAGPREIAAVSAWFAAHDLPLSGITAGAPDLEDVFLRLTAPVGDATPLAGSERPARRGAR